MKKIAVVVAVLALAGCSSGPPSGDMEKAVLNWVHENADTSAEIQEFKTGDCAKSDSQPGYACAVQANITYMKGSRNDTMKGTFVFDKIDGEWSVVGRIN